MRTMTGGFGIVMLFAAWASVLPSTSAGPVIDTEPNNSCADANEFPLGGSAHWGRLYNYLDQDYFKVQAQQGDEIYVWMDPDFSDDDQEPPSNFQLTLLNPSCQEAAASEQPGFAAESITYGATQDGWWYGRVWSDNINYGSYWFWFEVTTPPCVCTRANPAHVNVIDAPFHEYYVEERGNPLHTSPPVPGSGRLLGGGTWVYEETNDASGLQRGGVGILGDWFPPGCDQTWRPANPGLPGGTGPCLYMDEDPINDETCGRGPDTIII